MVERELEKLPVSQRRVLTLCDLEGCEPAEVCAMLELSEANRRVLLHRGRSRLRAALEDYVGRGPAR